MIPLAIEAQLLALGGFAIGMVLAYIVELRRRANRWKKRI
jgi:membrane associated rhomboid family serine protease